MGQIRKIAVTTAQIKLANESSVWDLANDVLYRLCRESPCHKSDAEIIAKVWLIGRSYAAAIERRKPGDKADKDAKIPTADRFYEEIVAPAIRESDIDDWLSSLPDDEAPGSPRTIEVHYKLMKKFGEIAGDNKRSLASKYLHFHKPDVFFIYDSRARSAITKIEGLPRLSQIPPMNTDGADLEYKDFVRRCVRFRQDVFEKHGIKLPPRQLDKLLLMLAETSHRD
ncbi:MAG: hypothetical protein Q8O79_05940 [Pseudomonadota bacterium]|nr:hypothetical protein [Pseudomonadota bacterium]